MGHGFSHAIKSYFVISLAKLGYALGLGFRKSTPSLQYEIERRAIMSSADYVMEKMADALMLGTANELLDYSVYRAPLDGEILEFGVYKAASLNRMARCTKRRSPGRIVWGFDSFAGLPSDWSGYLITKETFDLGGRLPPVESNVRLVKGFFDAVLDGWIAQNMTTSSVVSLLHIDSDLYESCNVVMQKLDPYIKAGTFILFDEYFNYPNWQKHEFRSFQEYCSQTGAKYVYRAYSEQKVLVEITSR